MQSSLHTRTHLHRRRCVGGGGAVRGGVVAVHGGVVEERRGCRRNSVDATDLARLTVDTSAGPRVGERSEPLKAR